ncbi:ABC transporter G family [Klebsormidium nitens]|uniref:ABC transporter G family n=1 Tax=Klebsormidium nitens TaxID=105231 RepID=A0A1Y1HV88_KLENI|nr:ABC transporter G family [Klebsormidium nitens]|eukprot:GAQ81712.1 ABC transporter G family [Klebsormidium nitens]
MIYHSYIDALGKMDCIGNAELDVELTYTGVPRSDTNAIVSSCEQNGLLHQRLCTKAEVILYLRTLGQFPVGPTKNCQEYPGRRLKGCYPGYASFTVQDPSPMDFHQEREVPWRTDRDRPIDQLACCPGFFCPEGLACMIPCPRGSFCPTAFLSKGAYSLCEPYKYHAYEGTCGGADVWGVAVSHDHDKIFCWDGYYCPTMTDWPVPCPPGHYCPRGSQAPKKCGLLQTCGPNSSDVHAKHFVMGLTAGGMVLFYAILKGIDDIWRCKIDHLSRPEGLSKAKSLLRRAVSLMTFKERWRSGVPPESKSGNGVREIRDSNGTNPRTSSRLSTDEDMRASVGNALQAEGLEGFAGDSRPREVLMPADGEKAAEGLERVSKAGGVKRRTSVSVPESALASEQIRTYSDVRKSWASDGDGESQQLLMAGGEPEKGALGDLLGETEGALSPGEVFWKGQPRVEVEFLDLTMVLPGGREVMAGVSGKMRSGRLTAIMGPSGAGKSLLLHALAGKETHCRMRGTIEINGRKHTRSLRKILGFVPQDDVVHGSLTVEENIWFSASYRLPAHASRQQRSEIVEHVLRTLGLQGVRHSLVGSVERRGVSGGQRKRVSVGLEMVAQPSLLLLDEPTSGLDSVSSLQMLHALKKEAKKGLNAAAVIHQPSYELLSLFDDVLLLNKGLVYLGPMPEVEPYFDGLGFPVPHRMNPADHFMNVMSDLVESTRGVLPSDLPQLWRQQQIALDPPEKDIDSVPPKVTTCSGAGKLADRFWGVLRGRRNAAASLLGAVGERRPVVPPGRKTPGFRTQFLLILLRLLKQQVRDSSQLLQDYVIVATVAAFMGLILKYSDSFLGGSTLIQESILSLALLSKLGVLRTFGADKLNFWRESASGVSRPAYFLAKDASDHVHTLGKSYVYMSIFYYFKNMRSTFHDNIVVTLALSYCCTGIGYVLSIVFKPASAQLSAAMTALVALLLGGRENPRGTAGVLAKASYAYYAGRAYFLANAKRYSGVWLLTRCAMMEKAGFGMSDFGSSIAILVAYGLLARAVAFIALVTLDIDKQA